jgi:hypothetical protein
MVSGHVNRATGRTHGCTDQTCNVKILLANSEMSTHGGKADMSVVISDVRFWGTLF